MKRTAPTDNSTAAAAYYTGVFALFPGIGLIMGPAALALGILALKAIRLNPVLSGKDRAIAAVVMGGMSTLLNWGFILFVVMDRITART